MAGLSADAILRFGPQGSFLTLTSLIVKSVGDAMPLSRKFHPQAPAKLASLTSIGLAGVQAQMSPSKCGQHLAIPICNGP